MDKILAYIPEDLAAPRAAVSFVDEVYKCYDRLEENPYIYEACRDPRLNREGYRINIVKADMIEPFPFEDESFDMIFHPVANVYIEDVHHVWRECYRILKPGGMLLSGLDNGLIFAFGDCGNPLTVTQKLPYNPLKNPEQMAKLIKDNEDSIQFSHSFDDQIGGQLKAGFVITGAYEDTDSTPYDGEAPDLICKALKDAGISTFWATRAVKYK